MLQRVDCYHAMFLNQTEMLMCGQLQSLTTEFEKIKVLPTCRIEFTLIFHHSSVEFSIGQSLNQTVNYSFCKSGNEATSKESQSRLKFIVGEVLELSKHY